MQGIGESSGKSGQNTQAMSLNPGPLLMLCSAFFFAVLDTLIKILGPSFRVWDIAFYRFFFGMVILLCLFGWYQNPFKGHNVPLLVIRGVTGSIAFFLMITAIRQIPLSTAMILFYSFPAFSALFSFLLFKEDINRVEGLFVLAAISGVLILFDIKLEGSLLGQTTGMLSAVFAGFTVSLIKKLRQSNGSVVIYFYFCLIGAVLTFPPYLAEPQIPATLSDGLILGGIVCIALSAQLLMNHGFQYCKSWEGGILLTVEVIFTTAIGFFLFSEQLSGRFWLGGLMIVGSSIALNRYKAKKNAGEC